MVHSPAASSLSFSSSSLPSSPFHHPQGQGSTANSTGPDNSLPSVKEPPPLSEGRNLRVDSVRPATSYSSHTTNGFSDFDRFSTGVSSFASSSRSSSVDLGRKASIATATAVVKIRPVLRVNPKSVSHSSSTSSSPQRRPPQPPSSPITTPSTAASDNYFHWKQVPSLPPTESTPPVLPDLNLRPESDGFSTIPGLTTAPLNIQKPPPSALLPTSKPQPATQTQAGPSKSRHNRPGSHNRTQSQKAMLGSALERAHTAVTLDNAGNYEGAMEAYEDACALLSEVIGRAGEHNDRAKLQTIKDTYKERINEIKALPPPTYKEYERSLPPRPITEEFTDEASLYTVDDDESTLVPSNAPSVIDIHSNGPSRTASVPQRRDSLYVGPDTTRVPPLRSVPSHNVIPPPLSPIRGSPPRQELESELDMGTHRLQNNRDSFTFGAAVLSPRFSPRKAAEYCVRRSASDASSRSSRSFQPTHSRQGSEEASTSWLNTIDESGSSVGEPSPLWVRRSASSPDPAEHIEISDEDFDAQLDAAVEAAYDDGYQVDYSFGVEEELVVVQSPRENVERAKARVKEMEREMEMAIQKEKERRMRLERERTFFKPKRDSDLDFYDDADDESEEERMLEEMTRGYTLDFDFDLDSKTALPRGSTSTQYSDGTLARGSMSSGYSSGTTWGSGHMTTSTSLTTVAETPTTPPPLPPVPPEELEFDDIGPSPTEPPPPPPHLPSLPPPSLPPPSLPPSSLPPLPPLPPPANGLAPPGLAVSRPPSVRTRRLSSLAEPLEPLKIETSKTPPPLAAIDADIPTTVVQGPSPQIEPPSAPATDPPPIPPVPPLNIAPKSPLPHDILSTSRPGTSHDQDTDTDQPLTMKGGRPPSPTVPGFPNSNGGLTAVPIQKTLSDDGISPIPRSDSPARIGYTPKIQGVPPLRQIHSSASLRSRNIVSPEVDSPGTPMSSLFASSSTSNLRKGLSRSGTPAATGFSMSSLHHPPPTAGGMNIFESKIHSPNTLHNGMDHSTPDSPVPLEPCPPETLSRPFWLMRCFYQTIAHPRGGYISPKLFVPREVWYIKGVKIKAVDDKINACDLVTAALQKLAKVRQDQVNSIFDEMQALEGVLDRAQTMLSKRLGNEVGGAGAKALYGDNSASGGDDNMVTTKTGNVSGGKGYFSLRKLRTKTSSNTLGSTYGSSAAANGDSTYTSLPMAGAGAGAALQPKRDIDSVAFGGPHATYLAALAKLFDAAQVLDRLAVFDDDAKVPIKLRVGFELSHRHAAEFFGFFICRFVLADVTLLLDKFVKRGSEWVSQ